MKAYIGLDISMNCTGMCFHIPSMQVTKFYNFINNKKSVKTSPSAIKRIYNRLLGDTRTEVVGVREHKVKVIKDYSSGIICKIKSAYNLFILVNDEITSLKNMYGVDYVEIACEGIVFSPFKKGNIVDVLLYNTVMYMSFILREYKLTLYTPSEIKKAYCGNGAGSKDKVLCKFKEDNPKFIDEGKIDDVADAYATLITHIKLRLKS